MRALRRQRRGGVPLGGGALVLVTLLSLGMIALPSAAAQPEGSLPTAQALLRAMIEAPGLIDYEGTKIISIRRGERSETVTILEAHKRSGKTRLEFLSPETVAGRIVIDNGLELWHYEPSLHMAFQGPSLTGRPRSAETVRTLAAAYHLQVLGREEVIGRSAFVLWLGARGDEGTRTFWVDAATGMPLRIEERRRGEPVVVSYFTRLSFSLNLPEAIFRFRAPAGARVLSLFPSEGPSVPLEGLGRQAGFRVRLPAALPAGVRFERAGLSRYGALTAAYLRYSSGGQPLSVFQTPARRLSRSDFPAEEIRLGGVTVRLTDLGTFRLLSYESGGLRITVIGAQPRDVLLAMAAAFLGP